MLAYDRHFSNPVIGGTGHAQCNIWSYELAKNEKLDEYSQEITNLVERGIVRILSPEEASKAATEPAWYLNHRIVE